MTAITFVLPRLTMSMKNSLYSSSSQPISQGSRFAISSIGIAWVVSLCVLGLLAVLLLLCCRYARRRYRVRYERSRLRQREHWDHVRQQRIAFASQYRENWKARLGSEQSQTCSAVTLESSATAHANSCNSISNMHSRPGNQCMKQVAPSPSCVHCILKSSQVADVRVEGAVNDHANRSFSHGHEYLPGSYSPDCSPHQERAVRTSILTEEPALPSSDILQGTSLDIPVETGNSWNVTRDCAKNSINSYETTVEQSNVFLAEHQSGSMPTHAQNRIHSTSSSGCPTSLEAQHGESTALHMGPSDDHDGADGTRDKMAWAWKGSSIFNDSSCPTDDASTQIDTQITAQHEYRQLLTKLTADHMDSNSSAENIDSLFKAIELSNQRFEQSKKRHQARLQQLHKEGLCQAQDDLCPPGDIEPEERVRVTRHAKRTPMMGTGVPRTALTDVAANHEPSNLPDLLQTRIVQPEALHIHHETDFVCSDASRDTPSPPPVSPALGRIVQPLVRTDERRIPSRIPVLVSPTSALSYVTPLPLAVLPARHSTRSNTSRLVARSTLDRNP